MGAKIGPSSDKIPKRFRIFPKRFIIEMQFERQKRRQGRNMEKQSFWNLRNTRYIRRYIRRCIRIIFRITSKYSDSKCRRNHFSESSKSRTNLRNPFRVFSESLEPFWNLRNLFLIFQRADLFLTSTTHSRGGG